MNAELMNKKKSVELNKLKMETISSGDRVKSGSKTILFNGFTWKHDLLMQGAWEGLGYNFKYLPSPDVESFQLGKEFGNNGQCNPTYFTVGNLIKHLQDLEAKGLSRQEITDNYAFFTCGSSGPCRFGMYVEEYRLALRNAGFPDFKVLTFDRDKGLSQGSGEDGQLDLSVEFFMAMLNAFNIGDVISSVSYMIRPFEVNPGETDKVLKECMDYLHDFLKNKKSFSVNGVFRKTAPGLADKLDYPAKFLHQLFSKELIRALEHCRDRFNTIEVDWTRVKPSVKIVGEFWAQTTEGDGNFNMFSFLESEGALCLIEPVGTYLNYLLFLAHQTTDDESRAVVSSESSLVKRWGQKVQQYSNYIASSAKLSLADKIFVREYNRLVKVFGGLVHPLADQKYLAELGGPYYNTRADGGEGHMEIGKAIYYSDNNKAHMILSLKPFGCMPSSQSDGAMAKVISEYKNMIFLPIETSGEGEVNAHSRVQMALGEASQKARTEFKDTLEQSGFSLDEIKKYVSEHPEMRKPMYPIPKSKKIAGIGANFVKHAAERMRKEKWEVA